MKGSGARRFLLTGGEASRDVVDDEKLDESDASMRCGARDNEATFRVLFRLPSFVFVFAYFLFFTIS